MRAPFETRPDLGPRCRAYESRGVVGSMYQRRHQEVASREVVGNGQGHADCHDLDKGDEGGHTVDDGVIGVNTGEQERRDKGKKQPAANAEEGEETAKYETTEYVLLARSHHEDRGAGHEPCRFMRHVQYRQRFLQDCEGRGIEPLEHRHDEE